MCPRVAADLLVFETGPRTPKSEVESAAHAFAAAIEREYAPAETASRDPREAAGPVLETGGFHLDSGNLGGQPAPEVQVQPAALEAERRAAAAVEEVMVQVPIQRLSGF